MDLTRRTILGGILGTAALAAVGAPSATAATGYATLVLSPHQDDEVSRLAGYIAHAADRGDNLRLLTATNGAATVVRTRLGLTATQTTSWRNREQAHAWEWLTDGRGGTPTSLGLPDGATTRKAARDGLERVLASMSGNHEIYVATWHPDKAGHSVSDEHPDHVACLRAAQDVGTAHGIPVRFGRHPKAKVGRGTRYRPNAHQRLRIEGAVGAYTVIGQRSGRATFQALLADPTSVITQ